MATSPDSSGKGNGTGLTSLLLWAAAALLAGYGILFIYSAGYVGAEHAVRQYWLKQTIWLACGTIGAAILSQWNKQRLSWRVFIWVGYFVSLCLLLGVLFAGREIGGARRWFSLGGILIQPAEFGRFFTVLVSCHVLSKTRARREFLRYLELAALVLPVMLLIFLEPSAGNACSLLPVLAVLLGIRLLPPRCLRALLALGFVLILGAVGGIYWCRAHNRQPQILTRDDTPLLRFFRPYHLKRLQNFLSPQGDWNERQAVMTVADGGLTGKGYLNGTMKQLGYLPRTVANTDFIFAVIAEEGGFLFGVLPVLLLYALMFSAFLHKAACAETEQELYLCSAFTAIFALHVTVGVGMAIRLLPIIGLPLPLLSYGGSFTFVTLLALGIIDSTGLQSQKTTEDAHEFTLAIPWLLRLKFRFLDRQDTK